MRDTLFPLLMQIDLGNKCLFLADIWRRYARYMEITGGNKHV